MLNRLTPEEMAQQFKIAFDLYTRGMWPFNSWTSTDSILEWWRHLGKAAPQAALLAVSVSSLRFSDLCSLCLSSVCSRNSFLNYT